MDARPPTKVVLGYESPGSFAPFDESVDAVADAMLARGASLNDLAAHFGSPGRAVEHAQSWAMRSYPVRADYTERCNHCGDERTGAWVVCARLIGSLEAGLRGDQLFETPPFPVAFPVCTACAKYHRMRIDASIRWHRPAMLIALMWTAVMLSLAMYALIYANAYQRFYIFMTLGTIATLLAGLGMGGLWMLKSNSIPPEPRRRLLWLFRLHSIEVIDLADDREQGVRAIGDATGGR